MVISLQANPKNSCNAGLYKSYYCFPYFSSAAFALSHIFFKAVHPVRDSSPGPQAALFSRALRLLTRLATPKTKIFGYALLNCILNRTRLLARIYYFLFFGATSAVRSCILSGSFFISLIMLAGPIIVKPILSPRSMFMNLCFSF